jgi:hypothetical protein
MEIKPCCVCGNIAEHTDVVGVHSYKVNCPTCGHYQLAKSAYPNSSITPLPKLAGFLREKNEKNETIEMLKTYHFNEYLKKIPNFSLEDRLEKIVDWTFRKTNWFGEKISVYPKVDYTLGYCENEEEFIHMLKVSGLEVSQNHAQKHDEQVTQEFFTNKGPEWQISLTREIWKQRETIRGDSRQVFIAFKFDDQDNLGLEKIMSSIAKVIRKLNLKPVHLKSHPPNADQKIGDKIIAEIRACRFLISECSYPNPNVFYEAGFARGLGRPVIYVCHADKTQELPFDTRQFRHLIWKSQDEKELKVFRQDLGDCIKAEGFA